MLWFFRQFLKSLKYSDLSFGEAGLVGDSGMVVMPTRKEAKSHWCDQVFHTTLSILTSWYPNVAARSINIADAVINLYHCYSIGK